MPIEAGKELIRSIFAAFERHDIEAALSHIAADAELVDHAMGMTFQGHDGFRQWMLGFLTALPDARTELTLLIGEGEWFASEHIGRGTNTGPLLTPAGPVPPTGRSLELPIAETYLIRAGKLARMHAYYDLGTMLRQLGLLPAPGQ